jgi:hypothetical protein
LGTGLAVEGPDVIVDNSGCLIVLVHMKFRAANEHAAALCIQWQIERDPTLVCLVSLARWQVLIFDRLPYPQLDLLLCAHYHIVGQSIYCSNLIVTAIKTPG